jgi:glycerol uptake facilitator-like aquaporin
MVKRLFELLGLLTIAAGVYFVVIERTKVNVCNATAGKYVGFGVTPACQRVVYAYFGGFILMAVGAMVLVFGILATRKAAKKRLSVKKPSLASQYQLMDPKTGRTPKS